MGADAYPHPVLHVTDTRSRRS